MTATQLDRIEWKIDQIMGALLSTGPKPDTDEVDSSVKRETPEVSQFVLSGFTTKQHAVLQMLLKGCSNDEIAERFGVSPNTAKVYVRTIAGKLGVNTRAQIVMKTLEEFNQLSAQSYMLVSDGLPKTWHDDWSEPDPFAHKLRRKGEP